MTKKQKKIFDFIIGFNDRHGYAPTLDEMRQKFGWVSVSTAHFHVSRLQESGYLSRQVSIPRSIEVIDRPILPDGHFGELRTAR